MRRSRRGRRFPAESRYSLSAQSTAQFSAPCPPHCGSACAPPVPLGTQKMGVSTPKRRPRQFCRIGRVPTGRICPLKRAGALIGRFTGRLYPRSLSARLGKSCQNAPAHFDDFPPKAWRASVRQEGTALGPRGPHVPWTGNARAFPLAASTPVLCSRAGEILSKRTKCILTISLFRRRRASNWKVITAARHDANASAKRAPTSRGRFATAASAHVLCSRAKTASNGRPKQKPHRVAPDAARLSENKAIALSNPISRSRRSDRPSGRPHRPSRCIAPHTDP